MIRTTLLTFIVATVILWSTAEDQTDAGRGDRKTRAASHAEWR